MGTVLKFSVADRVRQWASSMARAGAVTALLIGAPALAQVSVPGSSNPYLSGMPGGSACCGGDAAPAQSPVEVTGVTLSPGSSLTFSATGSVNFVPGPSGDPPDGGGVLTATPANNGISGASWPANALVAVFLDNSLPTASSAPANLDFSTPGSRSFPSLSPALKQVFFVGDGLTGNGTGAVQTFVVPPGATRLFLGTSDGSGWFNNSGAFSVTVTAVAAPPPAGPAAAIPTLSPAMIVLLTLVLAGAATVLIRRA